MGSRKAFLIVCLLSSLCMKTHGQSAVTDSLEQRLRRAAKEDQVDVLNQLTYEFISVDNEKVKSYNNQALRLSNKLNYLKGEAIAYTYRGVFEYMTGKFPEAHKDLHQGLTISTRIGDRMNSGYTLLQLGVCSLEEVENDSALLYFGKAYEIFSDSTNPTVLSKIYRNLSALYGQRYQYDQQQDYLHRAIAIRRLLSDGSLLADALALEANNMLVSGDITSAENVLNEAEEVVKRYPNDEEDLNDIRHLRALILFQKGDFDEAVPLLDSARNYYFRKELIRKYVTLLIDMGKVFSDRGEYELSLNNLYDALALSRERGFDAEAYMIRNRIGWINFHLGDFNQALRLANEGLSSGQRRQLKADLSNSLTLKGVVLTELNDFAGAKSCLDSVLRIETSLGDNRGISEALMNLGFLEAGQKRYGEALALYQKSIRLAKSTRYALGLAWSEWGIADIYFRQGNFEEAARFLDLSEQYCRRSHANELLIRNFNTRRDLLAAQMRYKESLYFSRIAGELKDSIHHTDLARRFVNLEKTQEIAQRDHDIKALQENNLVAKDRIQLQESKLQTQFILLIAGVIGIALLVILVIVYYRFYSRIKTLNITVTDKNTRIQAQADKLQEVNVELSKLYHEVSAQNDKIMAQANDLSESNRSIIALNRGLEQTVAEQTLELRTTNEELVRHNHELLQFSYTVSHNLRGPVARLLGLSGLVDAEETLDQAKKWIGLISKTAADLDLIIKDLNKILDVRNELDQYLEQVQFASEWSQSIRLLQDSLTGNEEILSNFEHLPSMITVRAMLQSTFYNLLSNAIKYRSPDRNLKVIATSRRVNGRAILEIMDNGLGIDTHLHKEKLFKLYKRFHTHVEGRGLGLYLIRAQLEVLHGTIEVESAPGRGSLFRVSLPLVTEHTPILV